MNTKRQNLRSTRVAWLAIVLSISICFVPKSHGEDSSSSRTKEVSSTRPTTSPTTRPDIKIAHRLERQGDEIVVCGQLFHTTAPVVLWTDPGGYDAYRVEKRFAPYEKSSWSAISADSASGVKSPNRFSLRDDGLSPKEIEQVRGGGWPLELLRDKVDQFVYHYDVCGVSRNCFSVLHDERGLSVHFMLDIDGTIYQTLDLKERAWHATSSNSRSIGIEIANMGAYTANEMDPLKQWYSTDENGQTRITVPARFGDGGVRTPNFVGRPIRNKLVWGMVQGKNRRQYDLTAEQYDSMIKLTATLCTVFPKIKCDYPRDAAGQLIIQKLPDEELNKYHGLVGHFHIQIEKSDPGPAFQWDRVVNGAKELMKSSSPTTRP